MSDDTINGYKDKAVNSEPNTDKGDDSEEENNFVETIDELLKKEEYREVWPVLRYMKENGGKLEQECIIVWDS